MKAASVGGIREPRENPNSRLGLAAALTLEVVGLAAVVAQLLQEKAKHRGGSAGLWLPFGRGQKEGSKETSEILPTWRYLSLIPQCVAFQRL